MSRDEDWLWKGSGEPDPAARRIRDALGTLAEIPEEPAWPVPAPVRLRPRRPWLVPLAAAAALGLLVGGPWLAARRAAWGVDTLAGHPRLTGWARPFARLGAGGELVTGAADRARLAVSDIGWVEVGPNSAIQLVRTRPGQQWLSLERGELSAVIVAPPRTFVVNTPAAVATDLGCAYRLRVDARGDGELNVTSGWVAFTFGGRESFVPAGAKCRTLRGVGPGTPRFEDAPAELVAALDRFDAGSAADPGRELDRVLAIARPDDALTLWHLLSRVSPERREDVATRLAAFVPRPAVTTPERLAVLDRRALDAWWDALGFGSSEFWRGWESEFPGTPPKRKG